MSAPANATAPSGMGVFGCGINCRNPLSPKMKKPRPIRIRAMADRKRAKDFGFCSAVALGSSLLSGVIGLFDRCFCHRFQICEASFEIATNHLIHVHEQAERLGEKILF